MAEPDNVVVYCCFEKVRWSDGVVEWSAVTSFNTHLAAEDWVEDKPSERMYEKVILPRAK